MTDTKVKRKKQSYKVILLYLNFSGHINLFLHIALFTINDFYFVFKYPDIAANNSH